MTRQPPSASSSPLADRDRGIMLPMVLVATLVFTMIGVAVASLVATGLRYGNVVEARADRLAAADGGLRYGVERLRNMDDLCSTGLGTGGGYTTIFPPTINGAATSVTCRRVGNDISDVQGWGVVITGSNVPGGQDIFLLNGSATTDTKALRGPVYVADPLRLGFNATLVIEDGDMWYTQASCDPPAVIPETQGASPQLVFEPSFLRGPQCSSKAWSEMFTPPSAKTPTLGALQVPSAVDDTSFPGCRVFSPGRYGAAIPLTGDNYFRSGDYYFENVDFTLAHKTVVFGFPSGSGDTPRISQSSACQDAMDYDNGTSFERGGATIWAGGNDQVRGRHPGRTRDLPPPADGGVRQRVGARRQRRRVERCAVHPQHPLLQEGPQRRLDAAAPRAATPTTWRSTACSGHRTRRSSWATSRTPLSAS